ncbi:NfeD family protein [Pontiellaceae bacterium B12227]|nr:NfeD family protein [Pontiellaceae bacterium B12227]
MIRKYLFSLLALFMVSSVQASGTNQTPLVYIIPIKKTIEPALLYVVRRGVDEAVRNKADAIIFEMDTPGGRVDSAEGIINVIKHTDIPVYTFVEHEAYSAGAIIALATPNIYMAPGAVIGAATPLMMSPQGGVQELPDAVEEKMTSAVAAMVRATAEQGGYDPKMAEAMVRADMEYSIDGEVISEKGRLLTLTNTEAERLVGEDQRPLLSKGTAEDVDDLLKILGLENAEKNILEVTGAERVARFLANPAVTMILMMVGFGGLWLEFKTPGFGLFGILGISFLLLLYFGQHIAGLAGNEDILLLFLGIALLAVEIFVIPGFGFAGISGIFCIFVALVSMMVENMPGTWRPISLEPVTFSTPLLTVFGSFALVTVLMLLAGRFLPETRAFQHLTLDEVVPDAEEDLSLLGLEGLSHSDLRPGGSAYFDGRKLDVVTQGDYIPRQTEIRVIEVHGNRIVVEDISHG